LVGETERSPGCLRDSHRRRMVKKTTFVIGGCRSGKSGYALNLAEATAKRKRLFIATCVPLDEEMKQRVMRHRQERNKSWDTIEAPLYLPDAITTHSKDTGVLLVDCLTLWISNLLLELDNAEKISEHVDRLTRAIESSGCPVILVSNEVGTGIVPENRLARLYRDAVGFANQRVAQCCEEVVWMVAGIPNKIKPGS